MKNVWGGMLFLGALELGCGQRDPWVACRESGASGFRAQSPACRTDECVRCVATLERAWEGRADARIAGQFRTNFMRASADARDVFIARKHPDARYVMEHCTAGLASGASCAGYTAGCVDALSDALRSGETGLEARRIDTLAAQQACPSSRALILARLTHCEGVSATGGCASEECRVCVGGHIAALTVSAPSTRRVSEPGEFHDLLEATPEPVARAVVEALGGDNAPDDVEPQVAQRGLRGYCIALVRRAATPPPFGCNEIMRRYLTQPGLLDEDAALEALTEARADVRGPLLSLAITTSAREPAASPTLMERLRTLPAEGTVGAVLAGMNSPVMSDAQYTAMRALLVQRAVPETTLPPATRPVVPTAAPTEAPRGRGSLRPMQNGGGGAV